MLSNLIFFRDFDEEDEEEQPNPAKAAKEMKEALTSGGVNAMADLGKFLMTDIFLIINRDSSYRKCLIAVPISLVYCRGER